MWLQTLHGQFFADFHRLECRLRYSGSAEKHSGRSRLLRCEVTPQLMRMFGEGGFTHQPQKHDGMLNMQNLRLRVLRVCSSP